MQRGRITISREKRASQQANNLCFHVTKQKSLAIQPNPHPYNQRYPQPIPRSHQTKRHLSDDLEATVVLENWAVVSMYF